MIKSETAAGTLKNGKKFFLSAHHAAHKSFTGQEHAEAANKLRDMHRESSSQAPIDEHEIHRGQALLHAAKAHAEQAKAKGLPPHNNPTRS
jgi:hypothetical protein